VWRLSLRDLRAHLGRYGLTFLAVTIGVGFVAGVFTLTDTISRTLDNLYGGLHAGTDVAVRGAGQFELGPEYGGGVQRPRIPVSLVENVAAVDGVAAAEGYVLGYARPIAPDGSPYGNPTLGLPTMGTNWGEVDELNPFELVEGRAPETQGEIVFDKRTADRTGYRVGDVASVQTGGGVEQAEVVGVARFGDADSPAGVSVTLFDNATAQALLARAGQVDTIAVVAEDGVDPAGLAADVRAALGPDGPVGAVGIRVDVVTGDELISESRDTAQRSFAGARTFLVVFALISVLVGTFVIYTSFSFIVAQRQRQVALLRAIGASRFQVLAALVSESLVVGVVASLVGYLAGVALAAALVGAFLPGASATVLPRSFVVAVAVGTASTVVSALVPAARASRVPPVAALRDVAIDTSHRSVVRVAAGVVLGLAGAAALAAGIAGRTVRDQPPLRVSGAGMLCLFLGMIVLGPVAARPASLRLGWPLPVLRGIIGRLAQQNAARNPRRTASTAAALMIGLGIVSMFLVVNASLRASLDDSVDNRFSGDLVIDSGTGWLGDGLSSYVADEVAALEEVDAASALRVGFAEVGGSAVALGGLNADTGFDLFDVEVSAGDVSRLDHDGIAVFSGTAQAKGWQVGDRVPVVFGDTGAVDLTIEAVFDSKDLTGAYVVGTGVFDAHLPEVGDSQIWIRLADGVDVDEARAALDPIVAGYPSAEVQDLDEFKAAVKAQYDVILVLVNALLALTILIAMIGIVNTLVLSVVERRHEIGLARAVGASRGQIRSTVRWEALLIAGLGLAAALAVGVFFGWVLVHALADEGFGVFALPAAQLVGFAAVTGVLTLAAAVVPAAWAGRRPILDAIAAP
jgi:putative ABC transport system permease protein